MKIVMAMTVALALGVLVGCSSRPYTAESIIEAQRQANANAAPGAPLSTHDTGAPVTAPAPNQPVEQNFRGLNALHWISMVLDQGNRIKLEDHSVWQVFPGDVTRTRNWSIANTINLAKGVTAEYPFRMTNADKSEVADVRLISQ